MMPPHRLSRSSTAEPQELLAAIRKQLPSKLPQLDERTLNKLKVRGGRQAWQIEHASKCAGTCRPLPPPGHRHCRRSHS